MTDDRKYRTEIPNIIDDLGLDPYERTLYVHYKRVCGASGGQCTEGVRGTAERTKMSFAKAGRVRQALIDRGLIIGDVQHGKDSAITITDIWDINTAYYADKNRPNIDGWTVKQLRQWLANCVPHTHLNGTNSVPDKQLPPPNCVPEIQNCVPHTQKKEPIKNQTPNGVDGQKPPDNPGKKSKPESTEPGPRQQLMNEFISCSGLKLPHRKTDKNFWWSSIGELYELFNRDVDIGKKMIRQTIDELRRDKMRVAGPESLIKTARDLSAQINHKPRISLR